MPDAAGLALSAREPGHERLDGSVWATTRSDGLLVLSERMESVRSVAIGLWLRQGAAHELPEQRGVSHLLEHLVFKGTHRRSARELVRELEGIGGAIDAYTTHESTAFQARVPEAGLSRAVDVLADLAFGPILGEDDLELERRVVLEELSGLEEMPEELVFDLQASFMYEGHPYGTPIIGRRETVERLGVDDVRAVHASAYRGGRAIVAAAGRVEHEDLLELVDRWIPEGPELPQVRPATPGSGGRGYRRVERPGGRQCHLVAGGLAVPYEDPLRYAVILVSTALGGGMSSRLFQRIREELGLAYSVYSFHSFFTAGGHVGAYLATSPETSPSAREALEEELRLAAETGLKPSEVARTKEELKGRLMLSFESPASRMNRLAGFALYEMPYRTLDEVTERIDGIDGADVAAAAELFHPDRLAVLELAPGEESQEPRGEPKR